MADRPYPHQIQVHPQYCYDSFGKSLYPQSGPSPSKVLAILALPIGGTLLGLSGISLARIAACLTLAGLMASGAFGLMAMSWLLNCFRQASAGMPQQMEEVKRRMQDVAIQFRWGRRRKRWVRRSKRRPRKLESRLRIETDCVKGNGV